VGWGHRQSKKKKAKCEWRKASSYGQLNEGRGRIGAVPRYKVEHNRGTPGIKTLKKDHIAPKEKINLEAKKRNKQQRKGLLKGAGAAGQGIRKGGEWFGREKASLKKKSIYPGKGQDKPQMKTWGYRTGANSTTSKTIEGGKKDRLKETLDGRPQQQTSSLALGGQAKKKKKKRISEKRRMKG